MIYGYARVSSEKQLEGNGLAVQVQELEAEGCQEVIQEQFTGTTIDRPEFSKLIAKLKEGDTLTVTKLDRIARTAGDGINLVKDLLNRGVKVRIVNMGLIDNTPTGRLIVNIMMAFAEFEHDMIVERTQAGKAVARTKAGFKEGRPATPKARINAALALLDTGNSYKQVVEMTGISKSTLIRANNKRKAESLINCED